MRDREYREDDKRSTPLAEMGYETEDLDAKKFAKGISVLFLFVIVCAVASVAMVALMSPAGLRGAQDADEAVRRVPAPPAPLLQSNVTKYTDMMDIQRKATQRLESYGAVDEARGIYHIPIEEAIKKVAQSGVPEKIGPTSTAPNSVESSR